jgi:glycosyltransferase involved in cell wall biosynthesis
MSRWKYGRANHYIAVSAFVKMQLVAAGVPDQKINIVHDGVPVLEPSGLDGPIVAPATEDPRKGTDIVRKLARRRNLEIRFSTDLRQDLAAARVFLYLTRAEGLGSGVLLAMSAGVPVVASRVGGLPEVIQHGVTGWLTENDPEAAGEAVERLLARPEWAAQLGGRAREVVRQRFTIDVMVRNTAAVYERVARC